MRITAIAKTARSGIAMLDLPDDVSSSAVEVTSGSRVANSWLAVGEWEGCVTVGVTEARGAVGVGVVGGVTSKSSR